MSDKYTSLLHWQEHNPLVRYREDRGMRQIELARLLDVSPQSLVHWEKGKCIPKARIFCKITELCKISLQDYREWYENKPEKKTENSSTIEYNTVEEASQG